MRYRKHSFRHAEEIFLVNEEFKYLWQEVEEVLQEISDDDIINEFNTGTRKAKSISEAINKLIDEHLCKRGWNPQSQIFADSDYSDAKGTWRLDFAKETIAVEVAFNHGGNVSWNLIKPILSSELNHVKKAIQTKAGILITATDEMKHVGGFDGAVGSYEKYVEYLKPLNNILTTPLMIIGLEAPDSFIVEHVRDEEEKKTIGVIRRLND